jgi:peptidoglycan/LPS O-acetylase OafA/YrhL
MDKTGYRPEVDGLRALAVAAVVLFHLRLPYFEGGFVGVDVFFVVSGYVITRLIYRELMSGEFTFSGFYVRRIRRLFPALFVTLAATFFAACLIYTETPRHDLARSLAFAALSASNVFFWQHSGYFDGDATLKPLLHTWSLAVEEQFYIAWPAIFIGMCLVLKRRIAIILAVIGVGFISLVATELVLGFDPAQAFYLMPYRGSEFAAGAALVLIEDLEIRNDIVKEMACVLGLILIAGAIVWYSPATRFPGLSAILPCAGAALIIVGGSARYVGVLMKNAGAVWIGRISYSLYLVHWPLFTLYGYWNLHPLGVSARLGVAIVSLLLAWAMYIFVEQPFRRPRTIILAVCYHWGFWAGVGRDDCVRGCVHCYALL